MIKKEHAHNFKNIVGEKFSRLTVEEYVGKGYENRAMWKCRCECGNTVIVSGKSLRTGNTKSCGCLNTEERTKRIVSINTTHNMSHSRLFRIWSGMKGRCSYQSHNSWEYYGNKGIKVCAEWEQFEPFKDWALANGYKDGLTIDRIDNSKGYSPQNCRWATYSEQANNRTNNRTITFNGETKTVAQWADSFGRTHSIFYGLSDDEVIDRMNSYIRYMKDTGATRLPRRMPVKYYVGKEKL